MSQSDEKLKAIAAQLNKGVVPPKEKVRSFLLWFGSERRGYRVVRHIRWKLKKFGLATSPDFEYSYIDGYIGFVSAPTEGDPTTVDPGAATADPTYRISRLESAKSYFAAGFRFLIRIDGKSADIGCVGQGVDMDAVNLGKTFRLLRYLLFASLLSGGALAEQPADLARTVVKPLLAQISPDTHPQPSPPGQNFCDQNASSVRCERVQGLRSSGPASRRLLLFIIVALTVGIALIGWRMRRSGGQKDSAKNRTAEVPGRSTPQAAGESSSTGHGKGDVEGGWRPSNLESSGTQTHWPPSNEEEVTRGHGLSGMEITGEVRQFQVRERMIWNFRVEQHDDFTGQRRQPIDVEAKYLREGRLSDGDRVRVRGVMLAGRLEARRVENLTAGTTFTPLTMDEVVSAQKKGLLTLFVKVVPGLIMIWLAIIGVVGLGIWMLFGRLGHH